MWNLLIGPVTSLLDTVLKRVLPPEKISEAERMRIEKELLLELSKQDYSQIESQLEINLAQAKSTNWFVAGARPFIMWTCGVALAYHYVVQPFLIFGVVLTGSDIPGLPTLNLGELMPVLLGMLGLGSMRSWEKWKGVNARHS